MPVLNINDPSDFRVASGKLEDGWTYEIQRIPNSNRFRATVVHPYSVAPHAGVPWPIEDPTMAVDPMYPTYASIEEAISAAAGYVSVLGELTGYPDPDKMSARGFRPALW